MAESKPEFAEIEVQEIDSENAAFVSLRAPGDVSPVVLARLAVDAIQAFEKAMPRPELEDELEELEKAELVAEIRRLRAELASRGG